MKFDWLSVRLEFLRGVVVKQLRQDLECIARVAASTTRELVGAELLVFDWEVGHAEDRVNIDGADADDVFVGRFQACIRHGLWKSVVCESDACEVVGWMLLWRGLS